MPLDDFCASLIGWQIAYASTETCTQVDQQLQVNIPKNHASSCSSLQDRETSKQQLQRTCINMTGDVT
jgi:hypothetical protein